MACGPVPTSCPQGLNGTRADRVGTHGSILGLPSQWFYPAASSELNEEVKTLALGADPPPVRVPTLIMLAVGLALILAPLWL